MFDLTSFFILPSAARLSSSKDDGLELCDCFWFDEFVLLPPLPMIFFRPFVLIILKLLTIMIKLHFDLSYY